MRFRCAREGGAEKTMRKTSPSRRGNGLRVVIAGGGVAALEATLALRALAEERVAIHLVTPEREFTYQTARGRGAFSRR